MLLARLARARAARACLPPAHAAYARAPLACAAAAPTASSGSGRDYDVLVVGAGPGGYVAAIKAAQLGKQVACVEKGETLGGTCLNRGCIPSKALLHSSELFHMTHGYMADHGVALDGVRLDWAKMQGQKDGAVKGLTGGIDYLFRKNKVTRLRGLGTLTDPHTLRVSAPGAADTTVSADAVILATGSEPIGLPFLPFDEERIVSSTGALALSAVPRSLAVIGGGVIGLELGSVYARLGSTVTVIEYGSQIGGVGLDTQIAREFQKILERREKMGFRLGTQVVAGERAGDTVRLTITPRDAPDARESIEADVCLVAVGRRAYTEGLGLGAVGITPDGHGRIPVDLATLRTTGCPSIYAIGDAIDQGPMLAHKAEDDGVFVAEALAGIRGHLDYSAVPGVIYTDPEVATVGHTEAALRADGVPVKTAVFPFAANSRAKSYGQGDGMVKIVAHADTDRILGVTILGPVAGELINTAVLAYAYEGSTEDLARIATAHPTFSEALREAAIAAYSGSAIHS